MEKSKINASIVKTENTSYLSQMPYVLYGQVRFFIKFEAGQQLKFQLHLKM